MTKETLIEIILGTIGSLILAFGMCMCLVTDWNLLTTGIIASIIGALILISMIPIYRKQHPKKEKKQEDWKIIITWLIGIIGFLIMGYGMSIVMIENEIGKDFLIGIIISVIGLLICVLNYPIYSYIKSKN